MTDFQIRQAMSDLEAVLTAQGQIHLLDADHTDANWNAAFGDDPATRLAAAAALFHGALAAQKTDAVLNEIWDTLTAYLPPPPNPTRAAYAKALNLLAEYDMSATPPSPDCLSVSAAEVEARLIRIARRLSDHVTSIARADYGYRYEEHLAALHDLLAQDFAQVPLEDRWCPMEVLELTSHVPSDPGHVPALAIVLLDAVRNMDEYGSVGFRWEHQHRDITALPPHTRAPLLAGFRYFYEADPNCDYHYLEWATGRSTELSKLLGSTPDTGPMGLLPWAGLHDG